MTEYRINLADVRSFADFVAAFNAEMIESVGGHWNGNMDAFNDYLSWPDDASYRLVLLDWGRCAKVLEQTKAPGDRSMLEVIREIFADNPHGNGRVRVASAPSAGRRRNRRARHSVR